MEAGHNNHNETHNPEEEEHDHFNVEGVAMGSPEWFSDPSLGPQKSSGLRSESRLSEVREGSTAGAGAVRRKLVSSDSHSVVNVRRE